MKAELKIKILKEMLENETGKKVTLVSPKPESEDKEEKLPAPLSPYLKTEELNSSYTPPIL